MGGSSAGGGGFNEMFRAGGHGQGRRFRKGESRMGTVSKVGAWGEHGNPDTIRHVLIGSAVNPEGTASGGRISAYENNGKGSQPIPYLTVSVTRTLRHEDLGKGLGMGMYLTGLKYAQDNNLGYRSDTTVSNSARNVWNALAARGVDMTKSNRGHKFVISPEAVQRVDIDAINRERRTRRTG